MENNIGIILSVGHNENAKGASNEKHPELNEYDINKVIAYKIADLLEDTDCHILDGKLTISQKLKRINSLKHPSGKLLLIELHFNAYDSYISNSSGCEVLIPKKSVQSAVLAECLLEQFSDFNRNRGILQIEKPNRGWPLLEGAKVDYACIAEPLFIDSEEGEKLLEEDFLDELSYMYFNGIINFLERIG